MTYQIVALDKDVHIRSGFLLEIHPSLQNYLRNNVSRDIENGLSTCYVLADDSNIVIGYYTLSAISIPNDHWDEALKKKYKIRYTQFPCTLLGKLAVDSRHSRKGHGEHLLMHAMKTASDCSRSVGSFALVVDPIDDVAKTFYKKYDFIELTNTNRMYISMRKIKSLFH